MNEVRTTLRDDLIAAKALIDTPEKWCKGTMFSGGRCCAVGSLNRSIPLERHTDYLAAHRALTRQTNPATITRFNDRATTTHADIMALFDRAIASAESSS